MSALLRLATAALIAAQFFLPGAHAQPLNAGPYVPTPQSIVDQMLNMANIQSTDMVYDLGSGDGRLVRQAARRFGARGFGVDIDGELVRLATAEAKKDGVSDRVSFLERDLFDTDIRPASVVTLYLLPIAVRKLRDKMLSDLRPGTRIVSHDYYWDEWQADNQITFDVPEKASITGTPQTTVYLWVVPAKAGGRWQVKASNNEVWDVVLRQDFQMLSGSADRKSTRLNSSHSQQSRMPSSA